MEPYQNEQIGAVFKAYPKALREKLLALRQLIFDTASATEGVGGLQETLKWGQPSYLTTESKSGTTIRIDRIKGDGDQYGLFVHCQTSLLTTYRELYRDALQFDGNRCIRFAADQALPEAAVGHCIALALTYHRRKRTGSRRR